MCMSFVTKISKIIFILKHHSFCFDSPARSISWVELCTLTAIQYNYVVMEMTVSELQFLHDKQFLSCSQQMYAHQALNRVLHMKKAILHLSYKIKTLLGTIYFLSYSQEMD